MQVLKFGGSSVADAQSMSQVIDIVTKAVDRDRTILVSSAVSGCTDTLITIGNLASQLQDSTRGSNGIARVSGEQIYLAMNAYLRRSGKGELVTWK